MSHLPLHALADDDSLPGMELLEFLAEWETPEGEWIDPVELEAPVEDDAGVHLPEVPDE